MYYHSLGDIPRKRHTQFRQPDGSLYKEEVVSSEGFSGIYSILYHYILLRALLKFSNLYRLAQSVLRITRCDKRI